jgi:hypothetical protein
VGCLGCLGRLVRFPPSESESGALGVLSDWANVLNVRFIRRLLGSKLDGSVNDLGGGEGGAGAGTSSTDVKSSDFL